MLQDERTARNAPIPLHDFQPHRLAQNGHAQTVLARRTPKGLIVGQREHPIVLDCGPDATGCDPTHPVRLLGYYATAPTPGTARGLALILHGWEGCSHSSNLMSISDTLLRAGYDVFRLNLRDHGPNIHINRYTLNKGLFLGTLIDEVARAARQVADLARGQPFYIVGGSMGGNFALRLALRHKREPIHNLQGVVAICPAVNPSSVTDAIDHLPIYRRFFRARWLRSLLAKQDLYPDLYDFNELRSIPTVREMTRWLLPRYSTFATIDAYFSKYDVTRAHLDELEVKTAIVAAVNDAVIPVSDLYALEGSPNLTLRIYRTGGHMGFVDLFPYRHWLPDEVLALIRDL